MSKKVLVRCTRYLRSGPEDTGFATEATPLWLTGTRTYDAAYDVVDDEYLCGGTRSKRGPEDTYSILRTDTYDLFDLDDLPDDLPGEVYATLATRALMGEE